MRFKQAELLLTQTFEKLKDQHPVAGQEYIQTHWFRYVHIIRRLPELKPGQRVLEIGASILSNVIRRNFGCEVHAVYHELEPEWPRRYGPDGITCHPAELMRDPLPVRKDYFDCILLNEVIEHFPLAPDFFMSQVIAALKPGGVLLLSVPNFARSEKRLALLFGRNPQDQMDGRYVYYAHHREPVMEECCSLIRRCGGKIIQGEWCDCADVQRLGALLIHGLRSLVHGNVHPLIHLFAPSTRSQIFISAGRDADAAKTPFPMSAPPLAETGEFRGPLQNRAFP